MAEREIDILVCSESQRPECGFDDEVLDRGYGVGSVDDNMTFWSGTPKRSKANGGVMIILSEEFKRKRTRRDIAPVDVQFVFQDDQGDVYLLCCCNSETNGYDPKYWSQYSGTSDHKCFNRPEYSPIPGTQRLDMIVFKFRTGDGVTVSLIGCYAPTLGRDEWVPYMKALEAVITFESNREIDRHLIAVCGDLNVDFSYPKDRYPLLSGQLEL